MSALSALAIYATAAMLGATVFVLFANWLAAATASIPAGVAVTLLLRLASLRWNLRCPSCPRS